ncbi:MAG TPA: hypothetical protein VKU37_05795 [Verrucomicrobiae bacterium]|nr:hypothetical protein [Verrucomicrobiae bacterium]
MTKMHPWMIYIFLVFFWFIVVKDFMYGNPTLSERVKPILFYVLPPVSIIGLWWASRFKRVTLDRDTLIVSGFRREARIPVSQIEKIYKRRGGRGPDFVTIKFKSETEFGRRVRIMVGSAGMDLDRVAKILQDAMEGNVTAVKINHVSRESSQPPDKHRKEVIVHGWTNEELSKILTDFADAYGDDLGKQFDYEVCPHDKGATRITFPHDIPPKNFSFLVNYLNYPKDYDLAGRSISATGNLTLTADFHLPDKSLIGKRAVFYIPSDDKDYDLIYVRVGGETFKNSFRSLHWKKVEDPRVPSGMDISNA